MTESPLAPLRCYLLGSRVEHDLDRHYPILVAPTGSCAKAGSSASLCIRSDPQSLQVAVSPCCIQLLLSVISADLFSDPWTPTTVADKVRLRVSSPVTSAFPTTSLGRLNHNIRSTTSERGMLTRLQSFDDLQASEFAATQVVPTAGTHSDARAAVALHPSSARFVASPRIGYASRPNRAIDGRGLPPPRSAALLAAPMLPSLPPTEPDAPVPGIRFLTAELRSRRCMIPSVTRLARKARRWGAKSNRNFDVRDRLPNVVLWLPPSSRSCQFSYPLSFRVQVCEAQGPLLFPVNGPLLATPPFPRSGPGSSPTLARSSRWKTGAGKAVAGRSVASVA
jgi:hypothetical protein